MLMFRSNISQRIFFTTPRPLFQDVPTDETETDVVPFYFSTFVAVY